ncbi:MAG: GspH/FimT family pseudopilin [Gammaproteobacteria bacterium]|nr:GspH/FimT family pseudopilin [Gammaproteobacteria bacterium]
MNTRSMPVPQVPGRQAGFNLLELMITLLVAGMVLGFGIPSFNAFIANNRMAAAANDLITSIHLARTEAVKRRTSVTVCSSSTWADANPDCDLAAGRGWIVFADDDGDVAVGGGEEIIAANPPLAEGVTFEIDAGAASYLQFAGSGFPQTAPAGTPITNIQLCDERGDISTGKDADGDDVAAGRWIAIGPTGRPQIYRRQADVQASPIGGC